MIPVLNALTTERFPTELRGDAFSVANNLLGRLGFVSSPLLVGAAAGRFGWGPSVAITAIFPLFALALLLLRVPETGGRELEDTARL